MFPGRVERIVERIILPAPAIYREASAEESGNIRLFRNVNKPRPDDAGRCLLHGRLQLSKIVQKWHVAEIDACVTLPLNSVYTWLLAESSSEAIDSVSNH